MSAQARDVLPLLGRIEELHKDSDGVKSSPRSREDLGYKGESSGVNRVARLLLEAKLRAISQRRRWRNKRTGEGWWYLCVVIDLHNGLVVDWSMSHSQDRQLVIQAVPITLWQREGHEPVLLHSDRSRQFTSEGYQKFLKGQSVICSMSGVGSCEHNAAAESFFGLLERERVNRRRYMSRADARADVFDYLQSFHNPPR